MIPSWDLLISAIFVAIIAFSFIVGKDITLKIIIAAYISILATDGLSYLIYQLFFSPDPVISVFNLSAPATTQITVKLFLFVVCVVILTSRGAFSAEFPGSTSGMLGSFVQAALGFLLAALITSTLLVFLAGECFLPAIECQSSTLANFITQGSNFGAQLLSKAYVWFMLPAVVLVLASAVGGED